MIDIWIEKYNGVKYENRKTDYLMISVEKFKKWVKIRK